MKQIYEVKSILDKILLHLREGNGIENIEEIQSQLNHLFWEKHAIYMDGKQGVVVVNDASLIALSNARCLLDSYVETIRNQKKRGAENLLIKVAHNLKKVTG